MVRRSAARLAFRCNLFDSALNSREVCRHEAETGPAPVNGISLCRNREMKGSLAPKPAQAAAAWAEGCQLRFMNHVTLMFATGRPGTLLNCHAGTLRRGGQGCQ